MRVMRGLMLAVLCAIAISGCAEEDVGDLNVPGRCSSFGVEELGYESRIVEEHELPIEEVQEKCGRTSAGGPKGRYQVAGCTIPVKVYPPAVLVYYTEEDYCTKVHELCHAKHGFKHTERYVERMYELDPRPSCPEW